MDKKLALITLIKESGLLSDISKEKLLKAVPTMPENDVESIGTLLAWEVKASSEHPEKLLELAKKINEEAEKKST